MQTYTRCARLSGTQQSFRSRSAAADDCSALRGASGGMPTRLIRFHRGTASQHSRKLWHELQGRDRRARFHRRGRSGFGRRARAARGRPRRHAFVRNAQSSAGRIARRQQPRRGAKKPVRRADGGAHLRRLARNARSRTARHCQRRHLRAATCRDRRGLRPARSTRDLLRKANRHQTGRRRAHVVGLPAIGLVAGDQPQSAFPAELPPVARLYRRWRPGRFDFRLHRLAHRPVGQCRYAHVQRRRDARQPARRSRFGHARSLAGPTAGARTSTIRAAGDCCDTKAD